MAINRIELNIYYHFSFFFSDEEGDSDDEARLEVSAAWGLRLGRRGSIGQPTPANRSASDGRDRIALDISILKRQYEKLRERQRQAHIILTSSSKQSVDGAAAATSASQMPVNQYLQGRSAIVSSKGRRIGPPAGAIPPMRKVQSVKAATKNNGKSTKKSDGMQETTAFESKLRTSDTSPFPLNKSSSVTSTTSTNSETSPANSQSIRSHKKSESSSYSDDSDGNSSTSTSLCDEENFDGSLSSVEASPMRRCVPLSADDTEVIEMLKTSKLDECISTLNKLNLSENCEILSCVSDEKSSRVGSYETDGEAVDNRDQSVKLEVICEENVDLVRKDIKDEIDEIMVSAKCEDLQPDVDNGYMLSTTKVLSDAEHCLDTFSSLNSPLDNDTELHPRISKFTNTEELSSNNPEKSVQEAGLMHTETHINYLDSANTNLIECATQSINILETPVSFAEVTEMLLEDSQDNLSGTLSTDTINLLKRIENSESSSYFKTLAELPSKDVQVYYKNIDSLAISEDALELNKNEPKTPANDSNVREEATSYSKFTNLSGGDSSLNNKLVEQGIQSVENLHFPIAKENLMETVDSEYNIPATVSSEDACHSPKTHLSNDTKILQYLEDNISTLKKESTYLSEKDIDDSNEMPKDLSENLIKSRDGDCKTMTTITDNFPVKKIDLAKETCSLPIDYFWRTKDNGDLLVESIIVPSEISSNTQLEEVVNVNLDSTNPQCVNNEVETVYAATQNTGAAVIYSELSKCPSETFIVIDSQKTYPSESIQSTSKTATQELLENSLLMEHILNPIVTEKSNIDDMLIEHFTSLNLDTNPKIVSEDLDLDSIEEIRRRYYASTQSLSNSLHEAEEAAKIYTEASQNSPPVATDIDNLRISAALLSSSLLTCNDHLRSLSAWQKSTEIPSTLKSSEIPSPLVPSPTSDSKEVPTVATSTSSVSKLSPVASIHQINDDAALSLKDNNIATITSTSQLSPMVDFTKYLSTSSISPLRTPANNSSYLTYSTKEASALHNIPSHADTIPFEFKVNDEGVTNEYFERVTVPPERPSRLELRSSTSDDTCAVGFVNDDLTRDIHLNAFVGDSPTDVKPQKSSDDVFDDNIGFRSYAANKKDHDFMKEKSFSLDEPGVHRDEFKPSSCPENALDINPVRKSERVSRIIQENSKILHRFLRRNVCLDEEEVAVIGQGRECEKEALLRSKIDFMAAVDNGEKVTSDLSLKRASKKLELPEQTAASQDLLTSTLTEASVDSSLKVEIETTSMVSSQNEFLLSPAINYAFPAKHEADNHSSGPTSLPTVSSSQLAEIPIINEGEPKDIAETISSIKNTIKSIDTLCKRDDSSQRSRDKTIEVIESLNECRYKKLQPDVRGLSTRSSSRYSRDVRREISPRRTVRDSDREEYESLFKRDTTMSRSTSVLPSSSCNSDLDRLYQISGSETTDDAPHSLRNSFPPINFNYPIRTHDSTSPIVKVTTENASDPNAPPTYTPPNKSRIRHTTVTSTFYDRMQAQQKEKILRMDRSPTSHHQTPVNITKAYINSLRVSAPVGSSPRSADASPSANQLTKKDHSGSLSAFVVPPFRHHDLAACKPPYKSCDNIPEKTKSDFMSGYKYA